MVEDVHVGWSDVDPFSKSEQAINQSTLRKPAQPHKPKEIDPNLEIWNGLSVYNNLEIILTILHLSMIEYSADILVGPPCVTFEN